MDGKELQIDRAAVAVGVPHVGDERTYGCSDAQFFFKFADECLFRAFPGLHFAAGKFPLEGHRLIGPALANENLIAAKNESGDHIAHGLDFRRTSVLRTDILHAHLSLDGSASKLMLRICGLCAKSKISG